MIPRIVTLFCPQLSGACRPRVRLKGQSGTLSYCRHSRVFHPNSHQKGAECHFHLVLDIEASILPAPNVRVVIDKALSLREQGTTSDQSGRWLSLTQPPNCRQKGGPFQFLLRKQLVYPTVTVTVTATPSCRLQRRVTQPKVVDREESAIVFSFIRALISNCH